MPSSFYTNYSDEKFIDKLKKSIDTCQAFYFSVSVYFGRKDQSSQLISPPVTDK